VNDDKGLALILAMVPEVKVNVEAGGELPASEELPSISQQVSQTAENQEVEEVVATTANAVPSATGPDEPRGSNARSGPRITGKRQDK
jgi:hypothetical protein